MSAIFLEMTAARKKLAQLVEGLKKAASGEVVDRAAKKIRDQIDAVARAKVTAHKRSGTALAHLSVDQSGGLIQLHDEHYLNAHRWWPFRRGMPPFVVKRASLIFARELLAALDGAAGAASEIATSIVAEADASEAGKAARKAERAAATAARKAARKAERAAATAARKAAGRA